jgi:hypothetical protein
MRWGIFPISLVELGGEAIGYLGPNMEVTQKKLVAPFPSSTDFPTISLPKKSLAMIFESRSKKF